MPNNIIMADAKGGDALFELIGETTIALGDYTNTTTFEETDTGINVSNTDYAWGIAIITCDTPIVGSNDWGATFALWGRYTSNANVDTGGGVMQRGTSTLSYSNLLSSSGQGAASYGVSIGPNKPNVIIRRKCHATACPLCRAGNYNVKVYGLKSFG